MTLLEGFSLYSAKIPYIAKKMDMRGHKESTLEKLDAYIFSVKPEKRVGKEWLVRSLAPPRGKPFRFAGYSEHLPLHVPIMIRAFLLGHNYRVFGQDRDRVDRLDMYVYSIKPEKIMKEGWIEIALGIELRE